MGRIFLFLPVVLLMACSAVQPSVELPTRAALPTEQPREQSGSEATAVAAVPVVKSVDPVSGEPVIMMGQLSVGQPVTARLEAMSEVHRWDFLVQPGDGLRLSATGTVRLRAVDPSGSTLGEGNNLEFAAESGGSYVAIVEPLGTGEYEIELVSAPQMTDTPSPVPTDTPTLTPTTPSFDAYGAFTADLVVGETIRGAFQSPEPDHVYTYMGAAGEFVNVRMQPVSGEIDPVLALYSIGEDTPLAVDDNSGGDLTAVLRNVRLPEDGLYVVQAMSDGLLGEYDINLTSSVEQAELVTVTPPPTDTPPAPPPTATVAFVESGYTLEDHVPVIGNLIRPGSVDRYPIVVQLEEGETTTLTVNVAAVAGALFRPQVDIYGPMGDLIISQKDRDTVEDGVFIYELPIDLTGVYVVFVSAEDATSTGEYQISYGEGRSYISEARGMTQPDRAYTGELTQPGLRDEWNLFLEAGDLVTAAVIPQAEGVNPVLEMLTPDGTVIAADDQSGGRGAALVDAAFAQTEGIYTLRVTTSTIEGLGTYTLVWNYLDNAPTPTPPPDRFLIMAMDDIVQPEGDFCVGSFCSYTFHGQAGESVRVQVVADDNAAFDPVAALLGPDGEVIAEGDDSEEDLNPRFTAVLPEDGTYTVRVNGYGLSTGAFNLTVEALSPDAS